MEENQLTDTFLALSPRAGRWLGILEKETQATWPSVTHWLHFEIMEHRAPRG